MFALLARVQLETTFRTLPKRLAQVLQQRATLGAARNRPRPRHVQRSRAKRHVFPRCCGLLLLLRSFRSRVLVSALPVFAIRQSPLLERIIVRLSRSPHKGFFVVSSTNPSLKPRCLHSNLGVTLNCLSHSHGATIRTAHNASRREIWRIARATAFCGFWQVLV